MQPSPKKVLRLLMIPLLATALGIPAILVADDHVVSPAEIQKRILAQAQERQENARQVQEFFASKSAAKALEGVPAIRDEIRHAVSHLDDQELALLATKVGKVQDDFAAGALTNQQLTYIVIALATAVIILVIVVR